YRVFASLFFFFFSSRRRHTRWPRDWSSDVCSSDLAAYLSLPTRSDPSAAGAASRKPPSLRGTASTLARCRTGSRAVPSPTAPHRSEERRVGKEWRSRWWPCEGKKKKGEEYVE